MRLETGLFSVLPNELWLLSASAIAFILFALALRWIFRPRYQRQGHLLTKSEQHFMRALDRAIGARYAIAPKVRIADVLSVGGTRQESRRFWAAFRRISSKHVDFVICEPGSFRILAAIELDDSSHQRRDRRKRDRFVDRAFMQASLPLIRVPVSRGYSVDHLSQEVLSAIGGA